MQNLAPETFPPPATHIEETKMIDMRVTRALHIDSGREVLRETKMEIGNATVTGTVTVTVTVKGMTEILKGARTHHQDRIAIADLTVMEMRGGTETIDVDIASNIASRAVSIDPEYKTCLSAE